MDDWTLLDLQREPESGVGKESWFIASTELCMDSVARLVGAGVLQGRTNMCPAKTLYSRVVGFVSCGKTASSREFISHFVPRGEHFCGSRVVLPAKNPARGTYNPEKSSPVYGPRSLGLRPCQSRGTAGSHTSRHASPLHHRLVGVCQDSYKPLYSAAACSPSRARRFRSDG